jgi:hypothetical protein
VLGQLQSLTDFAAIKTALDQPGGNPQAITASSITFDVVDGLFIQNNGASTEVADRGGFIADTIVINTASNATRIAVNGQLIDQGQTLSGIDVLPLVSINGNSGASGGLFNPASTINGCLIVGACAAPGLLLPDLPRDTDLLTPLKADDDSDPVIDEDAIFGAPLIELATMTCGRAHATRRAKPVPNGAATDDTSRRRATPGLLESAAGGRPMPFARRAPDRCNRAGRRGLCRRGDVRRIDLPRQG